MAKGPVPAGSPEGSGGGQLAHLGEQGEQPRGGEDGVESRK